MTDGACVTLIPLRLFVCLNLANGCQVLAMGPIYFADQTDQSDEVR